MARHRAAATAYWVGKRLAPPRFLMFLLLLPLGYVGWRIGFGGHRVTDSLAIGFDFAAVMFFASLWPLFRACDIGAMRANSARNDANRAVVLAVTTILTIVILAAIVGELPNAGKGNLIAVGKLIGTLALTWLFANVVYALHYAHEYYRIDPASGSDRKGLAFPGDEPPDYLDFLYFSFTLGMTFQTADVEMSGRAIRRIAIVHCLAAFVFNIGVIAFTINVIGGATG
ncbi:DUF1345 domain-containing protein [Novosphingobium sp. FKTRR1]|uniref:DUF1345 domain-containing protein n=1 Tax=Novosphingobium sp. FKTRR1 TaxID=2879118 RepID=UPI001CEFD0EB|nr:DUF1345 domain-containing protein [Novosphingobium sp. FKTRR1]